ncbi:MAG: hypothetical protein ACXVAO_09855, partial [Vulcanimicrobiaceae bacterium]
MMRILAFLVLGVTALSLFSLSVARSTTLPQISDDRGAPCCPNPRFLEPRSKDGYERRAAFDSPAAIAYDADDDAFFIADAASNMIRRYTSNGKVTTVAGACVRELVSNACVGRELDGAGRIARFDSPSAIVYDHGGRRFLVYDTGASALRWVTPDGRVTTIGRVEGITGLAINNRTGMLYGAQGRYVVQISIDGSGASVYRIWSIPGNAGGDAPADNVNDIAIDQRT